MAVIEHTIDGLAAELRTCAAAILQQRRCRPVDVLDMMQALNAFLSGLCRTAVVRVAHERDVLLDKWSVASHATALLCDN